MKFNEKLIELRKQKGLSQEELGYKLNVTRQTVSKWELSQTTPEMEKLIEISKLFNVSVDELLNESDTQNTSNTTTVDSTTNDQNVVIEDQPINKKSKKEKSILTIIIIILVVIIVFIIIKLFSDFAIFNKKSSELDNLTNTQENIFDKFFNIFNQATNIIDDNIESMNESEKKFETGNFNNIIEMYKGTRKGNIVNKVLDEIITSNKKNDKKITVNFNGIEIQNSEEIQNLKTDIISSDDYELSFDYDEEGYINKTTIEKLEKKATQFDITKFNMPFEIYAGSKMGGSVISVLDKVITNNKTNERKITVKYNGTETQDEAAIKNIKQSINSFNNYNISYDYDSDGFIYNLLLENL